jgi:hypothetical protein
MGAEKWARPTPVSDVEIAFGVGVVERLMPPMAEIPVEFKSLNSRNRWIVCQQDWFFTGLRDVVWSPKEGVDTIAALRHLKAIQGSWDPKHEHKQAAVAYLLSLWFDDVTYKTGKAS